MKPNACVPLPKTKSAHPVLLFVGGVVVGLGSAILFNSPQLVRMVVVKPFKPVIDLDAVPFEAQGVHDAPGY